MTDLRHTTDSTDPQESTSAAVRSLESLLDNTVTTVPAVRLSDPAADAVVVARRDREVDVVLSTGFVRTVAVSDTAQIIDDPVRQVEVYRRAVRSLQAQLVQARQDREQDAEAVRSLQAGVVQAQQDREQDAKQHRQVLREIREYAIDKRRADDICQSGLDAFLRRFDMAPDETLVRFTITGSYRVANGDRDAAESDGRDNLEVDLSQVDDVDTDSLTVDVRIDSTQAVDDD